MNSVMDVWSHLFEVRYAQMHLLWLGLAALLLLPLWKRLRRAVANTFGHGHNIKSVGWPGWLCGFLLVATWVVLCAALARPQLPRTVYQDSYKAREFLIGLDQSGSMFSFDVEGEALKQEIEKWELQVRKEEAELRAKFPTLFPNPPEKLDPPQPGTEGKSSRFALGRYVGVTLTLSRPKGDRVGMFTFDDNPYWVWPLSADKHVTVRKIAGMLNRRSGGGTNFDGPRPEDNYFNVGAFQACIDHFQRWGQAKTKVMILISDGDAGISPQRHEQLLAQMQREGQEIHIYALVTGPKSQLTNSATESVRKLIRAVNPNTPEYQDAVIWAGDQDAVSKALETINRLETSPIQGEPVTKYHDVAHEYILVGCALGALFLLCCAVFRESF
jgi:hypothetical protein